MALTTRTITNAGAPMYAPDGTLLVGVPITFITVNQRGVPINAWDALTKEYVVGQTAAVTDASAEFAVQLWCTDRSNVPVLHLCRVDTPGARPFSAPVPSGAGPLSWAEFMAGGLPLTAAQLDILDTYRAGFDAAVLAAATAAAQSGADRAQTGLDRVQAEGARAAAEDSAWVAMTQAAAATDHAAVATAAAAQVLADKAQVAEDRTQTGLDRAAAANSATTALAAQSDIHSNWQSKLDAAADSAAIATAQAGIATTGGAAATTQSAAAVAAKNAAESARDAAMIQSGVYATEAAGRAAVADGQYFKVAGSGGVAAYEYLRVSAGVSTLVSAYAGDSFVRDSLAVTITSDAAIVVDLTAKTVVVAGTSIVVTSAGSLDIPAQTVSFTAPNIGYLMRIWAMRVGGAIGVAAAGGSEVPSGAIVLGYIYNQRLLNNDPSSKIIVRPASLLTSGGSFYGFSPVVRGFVTINQQAMTVSVTETSACISDGGTVIVIPAQTVSFSAFGNSLAYLSADPLTGALVLIANLPPKGFVTLATIYYQNIIKPATSDIRYKNAAGLVVKSGTAKTTAKGVLTKEISLSINLATLQLIVTGLGGYVVHPDGSTAVPQQTASFSLPYVNAVLWVYVDKSTGVISAIQPNNTVPENSVVVCSIWAQKIIEVSTQSKVTLTNAAGVVVPYVSIPSTFASLSSTGSLSINLQTKQLILTGATIVGMWPDGYVPMSAQTVSFVHTLPNYLLYVYLNKVTGSISAVQANGTPPSDSAVLAIVNAQKLYAPADAASRVSLIDASGNLVPNSGGSAGSESFNATTHRMILPDAMYFLPSTPMALFKSPCFASASDVVKNEVSFWLDTKGASIQDRFQPIENAIKIDPALLGDSFALGYRHKSMPDTRYIKTIVRNVATAGALTGRSLNMLAIGDSLTEGGMASELKTQIDAQGATVTPVGTYSSAGTGGLRGEGRGYWNYRSFIGKDNYSSGVGAHTRSSGGKTDTTKFENPFLKLAGPSDKANHPAWCFRFTGVEKELSYADDADKTGNFYIFDFGWYRAEHSVPAPDFITIALSTNDINLDVGSYTKAERLQYMRLGLEIMVRQIKADLPSVKIGIIPAPAWSSTSLGDSVFASEAADWIENCITDVTALSLTYSGLSIVPVWPSMSEDFVFPYSSSVALSAVNTTSVKTITDWVHFDPIGRAQYGSVVTAWAACVL